MATTAEAANAGQNPVKRIRSRFDYTQEEFARLLACTPRSIAAWEAGKPISKSNLKSLKELDRLSGALARVADAEDLKTWMDTKNPRFEGLKPLEVIARGEVDRLWGMVFHLESGVPT